MVVIDSLQHAKEALTSEERVLVIFVARWCPPCRMVNLNLEDFHEHNPEVKIYKIDALTFKELALEYNATSVPVTFVVDKGCIVKSHKGYLDVDGFTDLYYNEE